jgi:hypothetical protein
VIANDVVGTGSVRLFDGSTLEFSGAVSFSKDWLFMDGRFWRQADVH